MIVHNRFVGEAVTSCSIRPWFEDLVTRGWTQFEIASFIGIDQRKVWGILHGEHELVRLATADKIACALGHHLSELEDAA